MEQKPVANDPQKIEDDFSIEEIQTGNTTQCDVKCNKCGDKRRIEWLPGMECPVCGSSQFFPIIKVDTALEEKEAKEVKKHNRLTNINFNFSKFKRNFDLKKILSVLCILILIGVWGKIGWFLIAQKLAKPQGPTHLRWRYVCNVCNHTFTDVPHIPPVECTKCHEKSAYVTFKCLECKKVFPLISRAREPHCPFCNSPKITTFRLSAK